ncbi:MacB family efflux pump subunit [Pelovirga terrestris]|uniref:Pyoverdine export ATP-binding/permease protein PvdT n=1 Tax=Pelovirga terrestris TaxID=2771352 RepID=A0A8J6QQG8_9BACT|nr:MacB family efflux pump subunit [Pelovirga terrestris]MBD1401201.1 MacB family efflux pump subunit [Pelovirga terrestris]
MTTMSQALIELRQVTKTYYRGDLATRVLHGIDLQIFPGEFIAIMGTSGSGKTTLMNLLGCLDQPTSGDYLFMGKKVATLSRDELARLRREEFGFVFQSYHLIATATAVENVEVPSVYAGVPRAQRRSRAIQLLTELGLEERLTYRPTQLSGGQQQRVSIARALMNGGRIILADEPTGALDSHSGAEVMKLLSDLAQRGHTVILITHEQEVANHADRIIEIRDGLIIADNNPTPPVPTSLELERPAVAHSYPAELFEATRTAVRSLRSNIFRTILTLLGIVIGVASVITMLAIGDGAKQAVVERISVLGSNLLMVRPGAPNLRGFSGVATLVPEDAVAVREIPNVLAAIPEQSSAITVRAGEFDHRTSLNSTSSDFVIARNWRPASGTFFTEADERNYATVAVLGQTVARALFPDSEPLGKYLLINNIPFQIIGTMAPMGAGMGGSDQDDVVFVPYTTGSLRLIGQRHLRNITVAVKDVNRVDETQEQLQQLLLLRHGGIEDFQIRNMASIIDSITETQNTLTILLGSIAAISLLVGGIGVMNIMLVSVTERTREIGIRMATGARMRNIQQQFLIEALVVTALGGAIGVIVGLATAAVIATFDTPIQYSPTPVFLAFGCAFVTGLVFGYFPARKAARLDPVVALASD